MYGVQLEKIKVAAPCTAEWRHMYGNDRVRFCGQCKLYVYNLSAMTREQAEDLIHSAESKLCVRFYQRKDGTIITQNCPQGLRAIKEKFNRTRAKIAAVLLTFLGSMGMLGLIKKESLPSIFPIMGEIEKISNLPEISRSEQFIRER